MYARNEAKDAAISVRAPRVGEPCTWTPSAFMSGDYPGSADCVVGRVIYVNENHRYFTAAGTPKYPKLSRFDGTVLRESFKF